MKNFSFFGIICKISQKGGKMRKLTLYEAVYEEYFKKYGCEKLPYGLKLRLNNVQARCIKYNYFVEKFNLNNANQMLDFVLDDANLEKITSYSLQPMDEPIMWVNNPSKRKIVVEEKKKYYDNNLVLRKYKKKIPLYFDCDGVILDTIKRAREMAIEQGVDANDYEALHEFFVKSVDWSILIKEAGQIDDSINKIKAIMATDKYEVRILTKLGGNETEEMAKRLFFKKNLPGVPIITVSFRAHKDERVNPVDAILIEDSLQNYRRWWLAKGVSVLFLKGDYIYDYPDEKRITDDERDNIVNNIMDFEKTPGVQQLLARKREIEKAELIRQKECFLRLKKKPLILMKTRQN